MTPGLGGFAASSARSSSMREQVTIAIGGHLNGNVPEPSLHHLERGPEPAVGAAVDAPRGVEVPERMQTGVLRRAAGIDDAGGDEGRAWVGRKLWNVALMPAAALVAPTCLTFGG